MGLSVPFLAPKRLVTMKLIVFATLLAMAFAAPESLPEPNAKADADPAYVYYLTHGYYPAYYYTHPYVYGHFVGKRSAEPESAPVAAPESKADPAYLYGYYGYPYYRGYYGHPYRYFGKRSADAEPLAGPEPKAEGKADPESLYYGITVILTVTTEVTTDTLMVIVMVTSTANKKDFNRKADEYYDLSRAPFKIQNFFF